MSNSIYNDVFTVLVWLEALPTTPHRFYFADEREASKFVLLARNNTKVTKTALLPFSTPVYPKASKANNILNTVINITEEG